MASTELQRARQMWQEMVGSIEGSEPDDVRRAYEQFCDRFPLPTDAAVESVDAGGVSSLLVSAPDAAADRLVVLLHGGGLMIGSARGYRSLAYALSASTGARVLVVDYRLSPEHAFPAALEDAQATVRWACEQVGPGAVAIVGDSAGGGLTMSVLLALKEAGEPLPAAAALYSPWADWTNSAESHERNKDTDPVVSEEMVTGMRAAYLQGGEDPRDWRVSAVFGDLSGLPPVLIFVGTAERIEDDSHLLARNIEEAGGEVELHVVEDLVHVYPVFNDFLPEGAEAIVRTGEFVTQHTSVEVA